MAFDPTGLKMLYDQTTADNKTIEELMIQVKEKKPIDMDAAYRVERNIDAFMDAIKSLPWGARMTIGQGKLKKIQEQVHKQIKEMEEMSKIYGVVQHPSTGGSGEEISKETIKEPEIQKEPIIQEEPVKEPDLSKDIYIDKEIKDATLAPDPITRVEDITETPEIISEVKDQVEEIKPLEISENMKALLNEVKIIAEYKEGEKYEPIDTKEEYLSLVDIWNEHVNTAAIKAYQLGQSEIMEKLNKMMSNYEKFGLAEESKDGVNNEAKSA